MLLKFSVENYKLFKDRTVLSMEASADKSLEDNIQVIECPNKKVRALNTAMVYGANASGKTKFFEAMSLMKNFVCGSHTHIDGVGLNFTPCISDPSCAKKPTSFEVEFIDQGIRYVYGFSYDRSRITEEHLQYYPKGKMTTVFTRKNDTFEFPSDKTFQEGNARRVRSNALYVSVSAQFNHILSMNVVNWFSNELITVVGGNISANIESLVLEMSHDRRFSEFVKKALLIADFGIHGLYDRNKRTKTANVQLNQANPFMVPAPMDLWVKHKINGQIIEFPLISESSGTIRFLGVIGSVVDALLNGKTLVIDEIDLSFHTDICQWIVGLFSDPSENKIQSQLLFNTHDVSLMDLNRVRRDQIWFMEKDYTTCIAELRRLSDYKGIRKDLDIRKAYLNGSFGAKPFIEPGTLMEDI